MRLEPSVVFSPDVSALIGLPSFVLGRKAPNSSGANNSGRSTVDSDCCPFQWPAAQPIWPIYIFRSFLHGATLYTVELKISDQIQHQNFQMAAQIKEYRVLFLLQKVACWWKKKKKKPSLVVPYFSCVLPTQGTTNRRTLWRSSVCLDVRLWTPPPDAISGSSHNLSTLFFLWDAILWRDAIWQSHICWERQQKEKKNTFQVLTSFHKTQDSRTCAKSIAVAKYVVESNQPG